MNLRTPVTLFVLVMVLLGAAYYGWQTVISPATEDDKTTASKRKPACDDVEQFRKGQVIRSDDVLVNVYNAGSIEGLAGDTLDKLKRRGFGAGVADNAPAGLSATNVTIITRSRNSPPVRLVAKQFNGHVQYVAGRPLEPGVDVVVGDDFAGIDSSAATKLRVTEAVETCREVAKAQG